MQIARRYIIADIIKSFKQLSFILSTFDLCLKINPNKIMIGVIIIIVKNPNLLGIVTIPNIIAHINVDKIIVRDPNMRE
jgi:hypothetical protein